MKDFPKLVGRLTKTLLPPENLLRFPLLGKTVRWFELLFTASTLIPWPPPCLCWVSGIHRECNHGTMRSTRLITVHERTAICKSQLESIIENPGNTRGGRTSFWSLMRRRTILGFSLSATQASDTLKSFTLFLSVKAITKISLGHIDISEIKIKKIQPSGFTFSKQHRTWSFHILVLQRMAKKCAENYNAHAQLLFCSLNLLFSDVAFAVMVFLSSLIFRRKEKCHGEHGLQASVSMSFSSSP